MKIEDQLYYDMEDENVQISKDYYDIKDMQINKEYYEKLKTIDYSKVKATLYNTFKIYEESIIETLNIKYDVDNMMNLQFKNSKEFERIQKEIKEEVELYGYDNDFEKFDTILERNDYPSPDIELIMLVAAYVLVMLQEPSLVKKFDLVSNLKNSTFPDEVKEIITPYISDSIFQDCIFSLINKFEKDELLAFIVFSFGFKDYFDYDKESYFLPNPLSDGLLKLFLNILNLKDNDKILNLYSNLGDFLIESFLDNPNIVAYGSGNYLNDLSTLKTALFSNNIKISNMYTEDNVKIKFPLEYFDYKIVEKIDKIFFNLSLLSYYYQSEKTFFRITTNEREAITKDCRNKLKNNFKISDEIIKEASLEWLFHTLLINQLKDSGKGISLVERKILFDDKNKNIRKYFIENGFIESVIFLPKNILATYPVSLVLIVFSKENKDIKFIDAYDLGKIEKFKKQDINIITDANVDKIINLLNDDSDAKVSISKKIEDFAENDYNLAITKNIEIILEISEELGKGIKLKDVTKNIMKGSQIVGDELNEIRVNDKNEETPYIYLSLSDINDGIIDFENIEDYLKKIPEKQEKFCIKDNSILLSKYSNLTDKIVVAQIPNDKKVLASGNFIIIEVDEKKLNPWYLVSLFSSTIGLNMLKKTYTGLNISSLSIKKLENIILQLPPIEEQEKIGKEYQKTINEIKEMKKKLNDKIQITKEIFKKYNGGLI